MSQNMLVEEDSEVMSLDSRGMIKKKIRKTNAVKTARAIWLISPLLAFVIICFIIPIGAVLFSSIQNTEIRNALPQTTSALEKWDGKYLPDESLYATLTHELILAKESGQIVKVAKRMSYEAPQFRRLIIATPRQVAGENGGVKDILISRLPDWGQLSTWQALRRASQPITPYYLLAAFDHKVDVATGSIEKLPADQALYVNVLLRTLWISLVVTLLCVVIGYPLAYWLARQSVNCANLLMIMVLLPFWTSLIVRTTSWIVLLQSGGLINRGLISLGIIDHPLTLVFNRVGVYISMTHILLPFIVLPLYSVMKGVSPYYVRAAISLGAHPFYAFWRVYVPQTYSGLAAGALLVFMMAIGYYVTPALLGGPDDQMISYFVAFFTNSTMNWGMAAALSVQLLFIVIVLYLLYIRVTRTPADAVSH